MPSASLLTSSRTFTRRAFAVRSGGSSASLGSSQNYGFLPASGTVTNNNNDLYSFSMQQHRSFSSEGGIFSRIRGSFEKRAEEKKAEKTIEQLEKMASLPAWTLKSFSDELDSSLSDWTTKIPGMGNMKAIKAMKESKRILSAFVEELGENALVEDMINMDRKQKVRKMACRSNVASLSTCLYSFM